MAVIRATRLWLARVNTGLRVGTLPEGGDSARPIDRASLERTPEFRAPLHVFTCPEGSKAIIRTMTHSLSGYPTEVNASFFIDVEPMPLGTGYTIHWGSWKEFQTPNDPDGQWVNTRIWSGQLVLNAGDRVHVLNGASKMIYSHASGHVLPIQA